MKVKMLSEQVKIKKYQGHGFVITRNGGFDAIFDSGSSIPVTPSRKDFKGEIREPPKNLILKGITKGLPVQGIGILTWYFVDDEGIIQKIETEGLYVPEMTIRCSVRNLI
ncbi:MAG: hypothetical protein ACREOZ_00315 [Gloeomargaritales cyanobacterium]